MTDRAATGTELFESRSVESTLSLGRRLAEQLAAGDCVALRGQLGAGKTVLARGIVEGLGIPDSRVVSSPTFVLVHEYPCRVPVYHLDLYRLTAPDAELNELGLSEMLEDGVALIEWADKADKALPHRLWLIDIEITGEHSRRFHIKRPD